SEPEHSDPQGQVPDSEALTARTPAYGSKPQAVPEAALIEALGCEPSVPEPPTASPPLVALAQSATSTRTSSAKGVHGTFPERQKNPKSPTARALGEALAELAEQAREEPVAVRTEAPTALGDIADEVLRSLTVQDEPVASNRSEKQVEELSSLAALVTEAPQRDLPESTATRAPELPPLYPNAPSEWRNWLRDLEAARGPKPLSAIERMFITSYLPLSYACVHGYADPAAERALENWSQSFAQSYSEAFDALRVRGKRPSMVLDAPELALRIGRLHGARSVQLLLVDGMRFDLGLLVEQRVRLALGQDAALTERLLLWAALPTTSEVQLDLLGRGPEALKEGRTSGGSDVTVARGRAAATLRRVKTHNRELLKLDLVEARLAEPGPREAQRLSSLADETAAILVEHISKQAPRTLVFAFGDHGFRLDPLEKGTRAAQSGGATPEEVLVPAFAWLVGGVH
ncbi:MAG TPA: hypothetical protein VFQ61_26305, partial [Polyangiaceae bacterium]|nr:hypothetical protein [Polyangiaceae bacterium]